MDRASARSARGVGVTAFGVNVIVLPPDTEGRRHHHERQEERCFLHAGRVEMVFGDGSDYELGRRFRAGGSHHGPYRAEPERLSGGGLPVRGRGRRLRRA